MAVDLTRPVIRHMIFPGMSRSVPVTVGDPVTEEGYTGFVWVTGHNASGPIKVHCSRLHERRIGY